MHRHRNIQLLQCLGVVFNTLWQAGCSKHCKTVAGGEDTKKTRAETQVPVLYWVHEISNDTCLKCWNITFNKGSIHERVCLQNPCLLISVQGFFNALQAFLTFVASESYSCTHNLHLKASSPLRVFLRNGNLSPHPEVWFLNGVQLDDFSWMGVF